MVAVVIPVKNEENRISKVLKKLMKTPVDLIIPIVNGCTDNSLEEIKQTLPLIPIEVIHYKVPLGIDVPRAIGAKYAFDGGAEVVLFVDGDMIGNIANNLRDLILAVKNDNIDMALTNCYPVFSNKNDLAQLVLFFREKLNSELGLIEKIGVASPSHGPHAVSKKLLESVSLRDLAVPPVTLAHAKKKNLNIKVATSIPHNKLGSAPRRSAYNEAVARTIIGDCLEAINYYKGNPRKRIYENVEYQGLNKERRWELLEKFLSQNRFFGG